MHRSSPPRSLLHRVARAALILLLALLAMALICFLPFAGRYLIHEDPLQHADAIVVLAGARAERWLEGAELYRAGWAPRVSLSPGRTEPAEAHLRAIGIHFPGEGEQARDGLIQMKVPPDAISILPKSVDNTAEEADAVREAAQASGWHRIILVTSKYHTRRAGFAFRRALRGTGIDLVVRASRYDPSTADRWWARRGSLRFVMSELEKLAAYRLGIGG